MRMRTGLPAVCLVMALGTAASALHDFAAARAAYMRVTRAAPGDADSWLRLATVCHRMGLYDQQVEATVESLTALIEPIMIGVMGFVVGGIVLSVFLPIFKMNIFRGLVLELQSQISHDVVDKMHTVEDADMYRFGKTRIARDEYLKG